MSDTDKGWWERERIEELERENEELRGIVHKLEALNASITADRDSALRKHAALNNYIKTVEEQCDFLTRRLRSAQA